jgi:hypothetical protein
LTLPATPHGRTHWFGAYSADLLSFKAISDPAYHFIVNNIWPGEA